jgi:hypothetical protein
MKTKSRKRARANGADEVDALVGEILRVCDGRSCVQVALALGSVARQLADFSTAPSS